MSISLLPLLLAEFGSCGRPAGSGWGFGEANLRWGGVLLFSVVYLALGVWLPLSLPDSGKKNSDYWKLLTGDSGHGHGHGEGHH